MKKIFYLAAILIAACSMNSCGLTDGSQTAGILSSVANGALGNAGNGDLINSGISILGALLGNNSLNKETIVGTWTYNEPQVTFESKNILGQIGGEVAANTVESKLKTQLEKIGLKQGSSKFTFDKSGNVSITLGSQTTTGTYTLNGNNLTIKGLFGLATINATVTLNANQLYMLFDANTIFNVITKLGQSSSSISSILGNFNGMKLGWSLTR